MADFGKAPAAFAEFYAHLVEFESAVPYFYCDSKQLVTIAVGYLVDQDNGADAVGERLAAQLATRSDIAFTRDGSVVGRDDVVADWKRVKKRGRTHPADVGRDYRNIAQLRISDQSIRNLTRTKVMTFADQLYEARPFVIEYDPLVAVAILDARFNPAAVPLYTSAVLEVPQMWNALNPRHRDFAPARAVALFEAIWAYKRSVPMRYINRHFRRVQFMRRGLSAMGYLQR